MFIARNREVYRDKATFGWNLVFPFLLLLGLGMVFSGNGSKEFKIGIFPVQPETLRATVSALPQALQEDAALVFLPVPDLEEGQHKLNTHKIDLLLEGGSNPPRYWLNDASPNGHLTEKILLAALIPADSVAKKQVIAGQQIRYIDWLFPGVMAMNMMFSALWGVGYIIVRYRKNGALKRLKATPLTPFEYLTAQMLSRILLLMFTLVVVWVGVDRIFALTMLGSYPLLLLVFFLGGLNLCSMGLLLAARGTSEEFTSGIINFIAMPMMLLSEVWFSLEGAPSWVITISGLFPITHLLRAARQVMNEGAGLGQIQGECAILVLTTILFLLVASRIFSWNR